MSVTTAIIGLCFVTEAGNFRFLALFFYLSSHFRTCYMGIANCHLTIIIADCQNMREVVFFAHFDQKLFYINNISGLNFVLFAAGFNNGITHLPLHLLFLQDSPCQALLP